MPGEYRAIWSTPGGGTGYSVFHVSDVPSGAAAQAVADAIRQFFLTNIGLFPNEVSIAFDSEVIMMDVAGNLTAVFPVNPGAVVVGNQTFAYNRAAGIRVDWGTGRIVGGRRLTGRTYLVPASLGAFADDGTVSAPTIAAVTASGQALITALDSVSNLSVWSRKHAAVHDVLTASVPAKGAILRGRRD